MAVTRSKHRAHMSRYFSQKAVTMKVGYGVVFAIQAQSWLRIARVAVQICCEGYISHQLQNSVRCSGTVGVYPLLQSCLGVQDLIAELVTKPINFIDLVR